MLSKWITICSAGKTVDGREVPEKWLLEVEKSYDPEQRTAVINLIHTGDLSGLIASVWFNMPDVQGSNFGVVRKVKTERNKKNVLVLKAVIDANENFMLLHSKGQAIFFSAEIAPEHKNNGAYLVGLAMTDTPACDYTEVAKFNTSGETTQLISSGYSIQCQTPPNNTNQTLEGQDMPLSEQDLEKIKTMLSAQQVGAQTTTPAQNQNLSALMLPMMLSAQQQNQAFDPLALLSATGAIDPQTAVLMSALKGKGQLEQPAQPAPTELSAQMDALKAQVEELSNQLTAKISESASGEDDEDDDGNDAEESFV